MASPFSLSKATKIRLKAANCTLKAADTTKIANFTLETTNTTKIATKATRPAMTTLVTAPRQCNAVSASRIVP